MVLSPDPRSVRLVRGGPTPSVVFRWTVGLLAEPEDEVGTPVADVSSDFEAARSAAQVAPVAEGAFGDPQEAAGFLEGEHLLAGVAARVGDGGLSGHGTTP